MDKPIVRLIEPQQEEIKSVKVSEDEARELLAKYAFTQNQNFNQPIQGPPANEYNPSNELTFEEMVAKEDSKRKSENINKIMNDVRKQNQPNSITFNNGRVQHSEVKYTSIGEGTGLDIRINIVSDMKINNNR